MVEKLKTGNPKIIYPKNLILGEGPIWMPDSKSLIWLDIKGKSLHTFTYITKTFKEKNLGELNTENNYNGLVFGIKNKLNQKVIKFY